MFRLPVILLCTAALLAGADDFEKQIKSIIDAYSIVEANASDPIDSEHSFYQGAIPGLLKTLDPHSVFFDPGQFDQLRKMQESTQKGFGTVVSLMPGRVIVLQTLPGTPSAKAGLMPGDELVAVNNYIVARLDLDQLTELLGESRQHPAQLDVVRPGSGPIMHMVLVPEEMQTSSVERQFLVAPGVGYLHVTSFDENTGRDIKAAIEKLGGDQLKGLVLDLRGNPGGAVTTALETASLFLEPGQTVFTIKGRHVPEKAEAVAKTAKPYHFKMAVLLNEKTASASEIVSGALQDHDRATIIGTVSYGKGLVQSVYPMTAGTGLALTTAFYYTPSGRSIQKPLSAKEFELGDTTAHINGPAGPAGPAEFHTDKGRKVTGGGGIQPDFVVQPEPMTRLQIALTASASFTSFATEYLRGHKVTDDFEVTPAIVDEFEAYAANLGIQPGPAGWASQGDYVRSHIKTEIFNQALGVERGDQVEMKRDPLVLRALEIFGG